MLSEKKIIGVSILLAIAFAGALILAGQQLFAATGDTTLLLADPNENSNNDRLAIR